MHWRESVQDEEWDTSSSGARFWTLVDGMPMGREAS